MARIRTIKPEFWTDGTIIGLSFEARLFYIGLWNFTLCDRGHLPDDPLGLKLKVLPADPVDAGKLIQELLDAGRLAPVTGPEGRSFLVIPRFSDHQKVDSRWNSRCPVCTHESSTDHTEPRQNSREFGEAHRDSPELPQGGEGKGKEGKGREGRNAPHPSSPPSMFCPKHPGGTDSPCRACGDARRAHAEWERRDRTKPTPRPELGDEYCRKHYLAQPCVKCAGTAVTRAEAEANG